MEYRIYYGPNAVHFVEGSATITSNQPNEEVFDNESDAIYRLLELDETYFPFWTLDEQYYTGERVRYGNYIFRALKDSCHAGYIVSPDEPFPVPTPSTRHAEWHKIAKPINNEEESN